MEWTDEWSNTPKELIICFCACKNGQRVWVLCEARRGSHHFLLDEQLGVVIRAGSLKEVVFKLHLEGWKELWQAAKSRSGHPRQKEHFGLKLTAWEGLGNRIYSWWVETHYLPRPCLTQDSKQRQLSYRCDRAWQDSCSWATEVTAFPQAGLSHTLRQMTEMTEPSSLKQDEALGGNRWTWGLSYLHSPPAPNLTPVGGSEACLAPALLSVRVQIVVIISLTSCHNCFGSKSLFISKLCKRGNVIGRPSSLFHSQS